MCDNFWKREAVGLSLICYGAVDSEIGKKKWNHGPLGTQVEGRVNMIKLYAIVCSVLLCSCDAKLLERTGDRMEIEK
jgi:hypothetical protein